VIDKQSSIRYFPSEPNAALEAEFSRIANYIDHWHLPGTNLSSVASKPIAEVEAEAELEREQGFQSDASLRLNIEKHAEKFVIEAFANEGITLEPHPKPQWPWDFKYAKDGRTVFIEVKGTQGDGQAIVVTAREAQFAQSNPCDIVLCIVCRIKVDHGTLPSVSGGTLIRIHPWNPAEHELSAIQYRCKLKS
jgi:hypothetical protein